MNDIENSLQHIKDTEMYLSNKLASVLLDFLHEEKVFGLVDNIDVSFVHSYSLVGGDGKPIFNGCKVTLDKG